MENGLPIIRYASREDIPVILSFIQELAEYEKLSDQVVATPALLEEWIFDRRKAEVLICEENQTQVGFCLFFHNFSTFLGRAGIYIEDLYVSKPYRSKGYGKRLLCTVARIAKQRGCGRVEWSCLNWNMPSIAFYKSLGAVPMKDWTTFRLTGEALDAATDTGSEEL